MICIFYTDQINSHTHTYTYIPYCYNYYRLYYDNTYDPIINTKV